MTLTTSRDASGLVASPSQPVGHSSSSSLPSSSEPENWPGSSSGFGGRSVEHELEKINNVCLPSCADDFNR